MTELTLLLRQWQRRPGRALATVASIAVAIGAIVATWIASDASRVGYRALAESIEGMPSVDVVARAGGRWDPSLAPQLVGIPGVRAAVPLVFRPSLLRAGDARVRDVAVGLDAAGLVEAGLLKLAAGRGCEAPDEIVLSQRLADSLGRGVGDEVLFFAKRGVRRLTITGIAEPQSLVSFADGAGIALDLAALTDLAGTGGLVDRIRLVLHDDASRASVVAAANARLPGDLVAQVPPGRASMADEMLAGANLGLDFVTALTVAMAWFIVGNAMLMNVTERRRSFALKRVVGASGRQISRSMMTEAGMLGLIGAVLGVVGGLVAADPIARNIATFLRSSAITITVNPWLILAALVLGPLVAIAAAWWPARQAARVDLLDGLANVPPPAGGVPRTLMLAAAGLWCLAFGILAAAGAGWLPTRAAVPAGIATLLAFIATTPAVLGLLARLLAGLIPRRFGIERGIALEQVLRQPVRTALTTGVLVAAIGNGVGLGHVIRDSVDDILGWYSRALGADWILMQAGSLAVQGDASPSAGQGIMDAVRRIDGVAAADPLSIVLGNLDGHACLLVARDLPASGRLPLDAVGMSNEALRRVFENGGVAIGTALARQAQRGVGDEITLAAFGRTLRLPVGAVVRDYMAGGSSVFLTRTTARRLLGIDSVDAVLITATPGAAAAIEQPLAAIAREHSLLLQSHREMRAMMDRITTGLVGALWSILGLGFVVGSLGVANTVAMNVLEKRRTIGLLRAVGMTGRQVSRLVLIESLLIGGIGSLIGVGAGIVTALFIQLSSQALLGHPLAMSIRPTVIAANVAAAMIITAVAAWLPARRAIGLDLLDAIAAE
ncbi:MAG: FtsX-like permease family protein [Pirellulales bacterium]